MTGALLLLQILSAMPDAPHLRATADSAGVPRGGLLGMAYMETRNNLKPGVRGPGGEWGRFQIKLATARARCPGMDVKTYDGNVACVAKMFGEDVPQYGVEPALCVHNTGLPLATCPYARDVLVLWKREDLWESGLGAKAGSSYRKPSPTTTPKPAPALPRRAP